MNALKCCLVTLLLAAAPAATGWTAATEGTARLEVATVTEGRKHSPNHVLAIWVTDAKTNFVTTVMQQGYKRAKYLLTWNAARRGNPGVDGETGATLTSHGTVTATWNGRNRKDQLVPDGTYLFFVEFTEGNSQGPLAVFPFAKGASAQSKKLENQANFKAITVSFTPEQ